VQDEDDEVRRGTITVTGAEPITPTFRGDVRRCCRSVAVTLNLTAGSKKLTFTHVDERAPSVDRIVISKVKGWFATNHRYVEFGGHLHRTVIFAHAAVAARMPACADQHHRSAKMINRPPR